MVRYSLAVVLSGLLLASGIGSASGRYLPNRYQLRIYFMLLSVLIIYCLTFSTILDTFSGSVFPIRLFISLGLIVILGILMGIPFPMGIVRISKETGTEKVHNDKVSLAWCLNGMGSVIGPVLAILLAKITGIASLFLWSALFYALAYRVYKLS